MLQNILTAMTRFDIVLRGGSSKLRLPKQGDHASKHFDSMTRFHIVLRGGSSKLRLPKQGDHASKHFDSYDQISHSIQRRELQIMATKTR